MVVYLPSVSKDSVEDKASYGKCQAQYAEKTVDHRKGQVGVVNNIYWAAVIRCNTICIIINY